MSLPSYQKTKQQNKKPNTEQHKSSWTLQKKKKEKNCQKSTSALQVSLLTIPAFSFISWPQAQCLFLF